MAIFYMALFAVGYNSFRINIQSYITFCTSTKSNSLRISGIYSSYFYFKRFGLVFQINILKSQGYSNTHAFKYSVFLKECVLKALNTALTFTLLNIMDLKI